MGKMPDFTLTEEDSGKPIKVPVGALVHLRLRENPTTGYRWSLPDLKSELLALESDEYEPAPGSGIGGGGIRHFVFRAKTAGKVELQMKMKRPWEGDDRAAEIFKLDLTITE
jgi:inhibitor of cysteine peptidase